MRWWWLIALVGCDKNTATTKPRDAAVSVMLRDASPDAVLLTPQDGEVAVRDFYIDKHETTVAEYRACVDAKACPRTSGGIEFHGKDPKIAMGGVTFYEARAYCAWKGKRLPTAAEWKRAAYGTDARKYPWGNEPPTCERAYFKACGGDGPTAPGRPAGASPYGALDMLGNVDEWTDPGMRVPKSCFDKPLTDVEALGGEFGSPGDSPSFDRDNTISEMPTWVDNRDLGIRCARSVVAAPAQDAPLPPMTWVLKPFARAKDAIAEMQRGCNTGEELGMIAGEVIGKHGWFTISGVQPGPPGTIKVTPPPNLVRVVGVASCDYAETTKLSVKSGKHTWKLELPSDPGVYEMWLPRGTWATFAIDCVRPRDRGECSFATVMPNPATFLVPNGPAAGVEGPVLESSGGMTCD